MKHTLYLFCFLTVTLSYSQIGIGTTTPDESAVLDITSTSGGLLLPRMTIMQRDAITTPAVGLMIYVIDGSIQCFQVFNGTEWEDIYCPTTNTVPRAVSVNFIGPLTEGAILSGTYAYEDTELDQEDTSLIQWYAADDISGTNETPIAGGTNANYVLPNDAIGKYISFGVTPIAQTGALTGIEVKTAFQGAVSQPSTARINEFHYDNTSTDVNEFVEIRISGSLATQPDTALYTLTLYNGSNSNQYYTITLDNLTQFCDASDCYYVYEGPTNCIQNGAPDGIALSGPSGLIEFVSYEGVITALNDIANGVTSVDIGVQEGNSSPVNSSIERTSGGGWILDETANTKGAVNNL
jgi:hypothetical protein